MVSICCPSHSVEDLFDAPFLRFAVRRHIDGSFTVLGRCEDDFDHNLSISTWCAVLGIDKRADDRIFIRSLVTVARDVTWGRVVREPNTYTQSFVGHKLA